jgi:hypothetical protein
MRKNWKYLLILTLTLVLAVTVDWLSPKALNWEPSLRKDDNIPFGTSLLFQMLPDLFPGQSVRTASRTIYEEKLDTNANANYVFVSQDFQPGNEDIERLLDWVSRGNSAFIAAAYFGDLSDTLKLELEYEFQAFSDSFPVNFVNPALRAEENYVFSRINSSYYFKGFDTLQSVVLGVDSLRRPNFIKTRFGQGHFYLHAMPLGFTNYHLLYRNNAEYMARALSYLPVQPVIWDEFYKPGVREEHTTPLRFFLQNESLRWAVYLTLVALVLFMVFEAKRRQRIIPVIPPLANTTLEFTETMGRLYFQHQDHKNIAEKKIAYLLDYIRSRFYLATDPRDQVFYQSLHQKTGIEKEDILRLFRLISRVQQQTMIAEVELLELNREIEHFYEKSK